MNSSSRCVIPALLTSFALTAMPACGGGESQAPTATAATEPSPTTTALTQSAPAETVQAISPIEKRLTAAGYHVERIPVPAGITGGRTFLTTGVGQLIVYIVGFGSADDAAAYSRAVASTASRAPRQIVARRVGKNVYSGVFAEHPDGVAAVAPFIEAVRAAEGRRARLIRISPR